jgi:NAD(P)-dependent dehydrogenase (short-subunit alcohol dehydrogenase family)
MAPSFGQEGFRGGVAFVTGAGSGIGRATAIAFARHGAAVALADVVADGVAETARLITDEGGGALPLRCDVTSVDDLAAAMAAVRDSYGRLDAACNSAGVEQAVPLQRVEDVPLDEWHRLIATNLTGVLLSMQAEIPLLREGDGGAIVNISSSAGVRGFPGGAAYGAAKHGVIGLTRCAALDHARSGIRINAICPGLVDTPLAARFAAGIDGGSSTLAAQQPVGRLGRPDEIAAAVLWLCSDAASFTIGHPLVVDGGQTL